MLCAFSRLFFEVHKFLLAPDYTLDSLDKENDKTPTVFLSWKYVVNNSKRIRKIGKVLNLFRLDDFV